MNKPIRKEPKSHYLETADHRYGPALADTDFSAKRIGHIRPKSKHRKEKFVVNEQLEKYIRVSQSALRLAAGYADNQSQIDRLYAMVSQLEVMDDELHAYVPTWLKGETHTPFFTDGLCVTCGSTIRNHT